MRKSIFYFGLALVALGAVIMVYGLFTRGELEGILSMSDWTITWYEMTDQFGGYGNQIGTSTEPLRFHMTSVVFDAQTIHIGFKATATIELMQDSTIFFQMGSDDGTILYVDGSELLNMWVTQAYATMSTEVELTRGAHALELLFYQWEGGAEASFDCNVTGLQQAISISVGGGFLLILGIIFALVGFKLKPSEEAPASENP